MERAEGEIRLFITQNLRQLLEYPEERPEKVLSSIDGPSKWRMGWFNLAVGYLDLLMETEGWIKEEKIMINKKEWGRRLKRQHKTGEVIDWEREERPIFPRVYQKIEETELTDVEAEDIYECNRYWCSQQFNASMVWEEDIKIVKKIVRAVLIKMGDMV